jgi:hypothetical protein
VYYCDLFLRRMHNKSDDFNLGDLLKFQTVQVQGLFAYWRNETFKTIEKHQGHAHPAWKSDSIELSPACD